MFLEVGARVFHVTLRVLLLCSVAGPSLMVGQRDTADAVDATGADGAAKDALDERSLNKAILEMLHINKVSASHQAKAHPYMRRVYQHLKRLEAQDSGNDGMLVQSFRSVLGPSHAPPGWIWFNVSTLSPSVLGAELVLFRRTLHPRPISVSVTLHGITASQGVLHQGPALEERSLTLDRRPPSGFDVFGVLSFLASKRAEAGRLEEEEEVEEGQVEVEQEGLMGFQLRYTDERGSLVLHEALTQSLFSLDRGSLTEPLLVLYQTLPLHN